MLDYYRDDADVIILGILFISRGMYGKCKLNDNIFWTASVLYSMVYHVMARVVFRTTILYFSPDDKFNL